MRDKQIEGEIKQEMIALQQRMDRLAAWRKTNFADPCVVHQWRIENVVEEIMLVNALAAAYTIRSKCDSCGMENKEEVDVMAETLYDPWLEFRPSVNDQVEDEEE